MSLELLQALSEARGVSGDEKRVRALIGDAVAPHVDQLRSDTMGNLLAVKRGDGTHDLRVMVAAHMDEVGLMVTGIDSSGHLRFQTVGGIDRRVLVAQPVRVGKKGVRGVIGIRPPHLTPRSERRKVPALKSLRIDIGADSKSSAKKRVRPGDYATFDTDYVDLGPTLLGRAFDDRAGCYMLARALEGPAYPFDLHAAFTVQEEVGLRGATVAAHAIAPDAALVLETGTTDDTPKDKDETPVMRLGHGPAVTVVDRSMVAHRGLVNHLRRTAEAEGIRYQIRAPKGGGTDAGRIHLTREGVPTAVVSIPCRYLHAPASLIHKDDLDGAIALVGAALRQLTPEVIQR